jgi:hypothetical protein
MQDQEYAVPLVEAHLEEVVSRPKRPELLQGALAKAVGE